MPELTGGRLELDALIDNAGLPDDVRKRSLSRICMFYHSVLVNSVEDSQGMKLLVYCYWCLSTLHYITMNCICCVKSKLYVGLEVAVLERLDYSISWDGFYSCMLL